MHQICHKNKYLYIIVKININFNKQNMIVVYIILAIIALIFLMFFIYNYKTSVFFNSIIKEYIILCESGNSRLESNKKIISKKLLEIMS